MASKLIIIGVLFLAVILVAPNIFGNGQRVFGDTKYFNITSVYCFDKVIWKDYNLLEEGNFIGQEDIPYKCRINVVKKKQEISLTNCSLKFFSNETEYVNNNFNLSQLGKLNEGESDLSIVISLQEDKYDGYFQLDCNDTNGGHSINAEVGFEIRDYDGYAKLSLIS